MTAVDGVHQTAQLVIGVCTALVLLASGYKVLWHGKSGRPGWVKGFIQDLRGFRDAILGREAVVDSITQKELAPALPGIGQRMATVEQALVTFAQNQHELEIIRELQKDHASQLEDHTSRLKALEDASVERIVTKAESAAAFRAMEAAVLATPDEDVQP